MGFFNIICLVRLNLHFPKILILFGGFSWKYHPNPYHPKIQAETGYENITQLIQIHSKPFQTKPGEPNGNGKGNEN
jgi:hypothetical protein